MTRHDKVELWFSFQKVFFCSLSFIAAHLVAPRPNPFVDRIDPGAPGSAAAAAERETRRKKWLENEMIISDLPGFRRWFETWIEIHCGKLVSPPSFGMVVGDGSRILVFWDRGNPHSKAYRVSTTRTNLLRNICFSNNHIILKLW